MLRVFKKVFSPVFMKKDIFDSISSYCQVKFEYQDLESDIIGVLLLDQQETVVNFTKDFFIKYLIENYKSIQFYIPINFTDEKIKMFISEMEEYDEGYKKATRITPSDYYIPHFGVMSVDDSVQHTPLITDDDHKRAAMCWISLYNYRKIMVFKGIFIDKQTKKYYFYLNI